MVNNKKEFIEKLNTEELVQLFENLLPSMGLTSVKRTSANCVEVEISIPNAGNYINCYLFFNDPLAKGYPHIAILIEEFSMGDFQLHFLSVLLQRKMFVV